MGYAILAKEDPEKDAHVGVACHPKRLWWCVCFTGANFDSGLLEAGASLSCFWQLEIFFSVLFRDFSFLLFSQAEKGERILKEGRKDFFLDWRFKPLAVIPCKEKRRNVEE